MTRKKWKCLDCKQDTGKIGEHYFVHTTLWLSIVGSISGMLCISCFETRLGRQLVKSDFTDAYINRLNYGVKSQRLVERLINEIT